MDFLRNNILHYTAAKLQSVNKQTIQETEILKFFGITLAMALDPCRGGVEAYFDTVEHSDESTVKVARNYTERFGMSKTRFLYIRSCLQMTSEDGNSDDPWRLVRPLIDAYNNNRKNNVVPGPTIVVDELMSMWYGRDGEYSTEGLPHVTKIKRKPRGVGAEMKSICDGESNIMLRLEIMEGSERQKLKPYHAEYGSGTSITMRLCETWRGSGRTVVADSAFASVKTLQALHEKLGLYFMGMVKTASTGYPAAYLSNWYAVGWDPYERRDPGSWKTLKVNMYILDHNVIS